MQGGAVRELLARPDTDPAHKIRPFVESHRPLVSLAPPDRRFLKDVNGIAFGLKSPVDRPAYNWIKLRPPR
jgi:hypothetical protein